ncbi:MULTISPECIES: Crp/Fnr family transcriptional regulator [Marinobacter]|uniref:CRP/FNR family transcriptional regulator, anaerobic regulatory protein n=1 Tax=Marinobacter segnicrescens TaxID=430453 RepID=A0A1I0B5C3_9GAMM|nr:MULTISPECIES: Crp/Fnr family transcriptional regulator [Marinobacter]UZD66933.1 Crp/Fnr family transcriptional regulator [Marinobacter sp. AN1]SET01708.1 CRP/FNR family transcriptional regulator, anaerobic regulatory protein [Marinobacter segnicrescens]
MAAQHALLECLSPPLRMEAERYAQPVHLSAGDVVFRAGDSCRGLPLVISGSVRVQMLGASGHGIVLYRMGPDDLCTLSIGCLMAGRGYRAEAHVEEPTEALLMPRQAFDRLMAQSAEFRQQVMASYGRRLDDLMLLVEEIAFGRLDQRLLEWLRAHANGRPALITHQELAVELGTAREVVSRLLKDFERHGRVRLARGRVELLESQEID